MSGNPAPSKHKFKEIEEVWYIHPSTSHILDGN